MHKYSIYDQRNNMIIIYYLKCDNGIFLYKIKALLNFSFFLPRKLCEYNKIYSYQLWINKYVSIIILYLRHQWYNIYAKILFFLFDIIQII